MRLAVQSAEGAPPPGASSFPPPNPAEVVSTRLSFPASDFSLAVSFASGSTAFASSGSGSSCCGTGTT